MRLLAFLPWTVAVALQTSKEEELPRRAFGADVRNCRVGTKSRTESEVIGGHIVSDREKYPFLTWVGDNDGSDMAQFCGGSLIHPRVVMTAAHCVYSDDTKNLGIYVRFHLTNFGKMKGARRNVVNWRVHEHFSTYTLKDDIALFLLDSDVEEHEATPVTLSDGSEPHDHENNATIVGWGSTDEECRVYDTYLRDSNVPIGPRGTACNTPGSKTLTAKDINSDKQICAGYYTKGSMEYPGCGDSGGPLLTWNSTSSTFTQVGFVSWSYGIPYPDVFTRVSAYRDWLDENIADLIKDGPHPLAKDRIKQDAEAKKADVRAEDNSTAPADEKTSAPVDEAKANA
mmetsp:Transcript_35606/g.80432  ORF Transcript_35606/g.80432 Transcript_35606/m.80432 type:complete len:342 (-) Transcript_35606:182-1207(-)